MSPSDTCLLWTHFCSVLLITAKWHKISQIPFIHSLYHFHTWYNVQLYADGADMARSLCACLSVPITPFIVSRK